MNNIRRVVESLEEVPINSQMIKGFIVRMNNYARNHNAKVLYTKDTITVVPLFNQSNTDQIEFINGIDQNVVNKVMEMIDTLTDTSSIESTNDAEDTMIDDSVMLSEDENSAIDNSLNTDDMTEEDVIDEVDKDIDEYDQDQ